VLATACSLGTCCLRRATKRKHNEIQCVRIFQAPTDFGIETDGRRSERCQEDVEAELLDSLKSVGMADGIRTLISLRNLDSDLRRRLKQVLRRLVVEVSENEEPDDLDDEAEEEEGGVGDDEEEGDGDEWVIMTHDLQALEDQTAMEVEGDDDDDDDEEEGDGHVEDSNEWQRVAARTRADEGEDSRDSTQESQVSALSSTPHGPRSGSTFNWP